MSELHNRRIFLRAAVAAGAAWAVADIAEVEDALVWASQQATERKGPEFSVLTPDEGEVIAAMAARVLPSVNGRPGAREAGAAYFIDRSLATFNKGQRQLYSEGVADLNNRATRAWKESPGFVPLTATQQDTLLHEIESTPFFQAARFDTIVGTFALPTWGGNRDYAGWHLLGFTHQSSFEPPFGFYDAEVNRRK